MSGVLTAAVIEELIAKMPPKVPNAARGRAADATRELTNMRQRAETAEARIKELDVMLDMLPEYLEYWGACDGPALSLSEWWSCKKNGYQE